MNTLKNIKNILIGLLIALSINTPYLPAVSKVLTGEVELDWPLLNQQERDKTISYYHNILFENIRKKVDKESFSEHKKDKERDFNEYFVKNNMLSLADRKLAGFFIFNKILYAYAIKYENDKKNIYYYDAMGNLRYIDLLQKPYDEYPNIAIQYDNKGKLKGATYYISEEDQYSFKADGQFYCRWYQDKCYDKKAKMVITRRIQE